MMFVPAAIVQLRDNMLDGSSNITTRFNYYQSMLRVKEYAEKACADYERKNKVR
jgi:hypothetical protein